MIDAALDPLSQIAIACGTDKWGAHRYTPDYHRMLCHRRHEKLRILEIGVGGYKGKKMGGRSLRMWAEYFPNASIVGLDIHEKELDLPPQVTVIQGSQTDQALLARLSEEHGPFDIVIDDGSHMVNHVLATFETLFPLVAPDGVYAVEDVQTAFWPAYGGNASGSGTIISRTLGLIRAMHADEVTALGGAPIDTKWGDMICGIHFFRNVILIERGPNDYPSNARFDPTRPSFQQALRELEAEIARAPSEGAVLTRMAMLRLAGQNVQALGIATAALSRYPQSIDLVVNAYQLAEGMGRAPEARLLKARLEQLTAEEAIDQESQQ